MGYVAIGDLQPHWSKAVGMRLVAYSPHAEEEV